MNIIILGAGAIGSLFGAYLAKNNAVVLIGRSAHVKAIRKNGLKITGKTRMIMHVAAEDSAAHVSCSPDIILVTVKSYDTEQALQEAQSLIHSKTVVLSLQNGLDNIDKIKKYVEPQHIMGGVTTHGALFVKPGVIRHTGMGRTAVGNLTGQRTKRLNHVVSALNDAGIETQRSVHLMNDMWMKAVVNSSINPLTAFFSCKNGYLLANPILKDIVDKVCKESVSVAQAYGIDMGYQDAVESTRKVIRDTADNYSSMMQSIQRGRKTEIDAINGIICQIGRRYHIDVSLNELLIFLVNSLQRG